MSNLISIIGIATLNLWCILCMFVCITPQASFFFHTNRSLFAFGTLKIYLFHVLCSWHSVCYYLYAMWHFFRRLHNGLDFFLEVNWYLFSFNCCSLGGFWAAYWNASSEFPLNFSVSLFKIVPSYFSVCAISINF